MLVLPLGLVFSQIPTLKPKAWRGFSSLCLPLIEDWGEGWGAPDITTRAWWALSVQGSGQRASSASTTIPGEFLPHWCQTLPRQWNQTVWGQDGKASSFRNSSRNSLPGCLGVVLCGWWDSPLPLGKFAKCCNCCCLIVCTFNVYELKGTATFHAPGSVSRTLWSFPRFPPAPRVCPDCLLAAESLPKPLDILAIYPPWPPALGCTASCPKFFLAALTGLGEV